MNFASRNLQKKLNESNKRTQGRQIKNPLTYFHNKNKQKYRECLNMIEQWSQDLLQRQNNIHKIHQKFVQDQQEKDNKQFNTNSMSNNTNGSNHFAQIDIEQILSQQFVKKMESLYMKQFMLRDFQDENLKNKSIQEHTFSDMQYM